MIGSKRCIFTHIVQEENYIDDTLVNRGHDLYGMIFQTSLCLFSLEISTRIKSPQFLVIFIFIFSIKS